MGVCEPPALPMPCKMLTNTTELSRTAGASLLAALLMDDPPCCPATDSGAYKRRVCLLQQAARPLPTCTPDA